MKARQFLLVAALAAVGFLLMAWRYHAQARSAQNRIQALQLEVTADRAKRDRQEARLKAAHTKPTATAKADKPKASGGVNFLEILRTDPRVQSRFIAYEKSGLGMKYGPLFRDLGLTPGQIARCEDNLSKRDELYLDLDEATRTQGIHGGPAAAKVYDQMLAGYTADQVALLGSDGAQKLNDYDTTFASTAMVNGMAGGATVAGNPLTADQLQQLSGAVLAATKAITVMDPDGVDWAAVDAKASSFLTPEQLNLLQNGEFIGPFGMGSRFQIRLNNLISQADQADRLADPAPGG
jgi:hypothetical protein